MKVTTGKHFNGLYWTHETSNGDSLSIILHDYSYGHEQGLFESMASWEDDAEGNLDFGAVQKKIDYIYALENKNEHLD